MISQTLSAQLEQAQNRGEFVELAEKHCLLLRDSLKMPCVFAYEQGDFKNKITSKAFCLHCGTSEDLGEAMDEVVYCHACDEKRANAKDAYAERMEQQRLQEELEEQRRRDYLGAINDPWFGATHVPHHVVAGEAFDDKMALYQNEY